MIYECELTEGDLEGDFMYIHDCPLFRSMKRAGVPLFNVGGDNFYIIDKVTHNFTLRMNELATKILESDRPNLIGERFTVEL